MAAVLSGFPDNSQNSAYSFGFGFIIFEAPLIILSRI
jgi:hypothetical protein